MVCPSCRSATRVLESRHADEGVAIRRRRECPACGHRFTTYERREPPPLHVRKRDGRRERFDRVKLRDGMVRAAYKRPVESHEIDAIVNRIEAEAEAAGGELDARRIGELCLAGLGDVDRISYLQFASVYRQLADVEDVQTELARLGTVPSAGDRGLDGPREARSDAPVPSDSDASIPTPSRRPARAGQR
jgi:transcriptional repressor NrdR